MPNILLIGGGAREHAIGWSLVKDPRVSLYTVAHNHNPGLFQMSKEYLRLLETEVLPIVAWAVEKSINLAIIGLEEPLACGLVDALEEAGIATVGPRSQAARLETSKSFTRDLMKRHGIDGQAEYHYFTDADEAEAFLRRTDNEYALKPDGLTAGQGVRIMGEHFATRDEAIQYARRVIVESIGGVPGIVIEERLVGHEFTLQCFVDGSVVRPMPMVRDYKRAFNGDRGPNTGSMGSYSTGTGLLPFVGEIERQQALSVLKQIANAMQSEGMPYRGIMYGQFMRTASGIRLIEINARFGDPEAINVLAILESNFYEICRAMVEGRLASADIRFESVATVCTYITPRGYGEHPQADTQLEVDHDGILSKGVLLFYAKVNEVDGRILTTRSRSIGLLGIADTVASARKKVQEALLLVSGPSHARTDIGEEADLFSQQQAVAAGSRSVNHD